MKRREFLHYASAGIACAVGGGAVRSAEKTPGVLAAKPPMGWNSFDSYGVNRWSSRPERALPKPNIALLPPRDSDTIEGPACGGRGRRFIGNVGVTGPRRHMTPGTRDPNAGERIMSKIASITAVAIALLLSSATLLAQDTAAPAADPAAQKKALETQRKELKKQLSAIAKKIAASPAVADLQTACEAADKIYQAAKKSPAIIEARKAASAASKVYSKATLAMPEYAAVKTADKAYEAARLAMPEYKVRKGAESALKKLSKDDAGYADAKTAAGDAKKAYETARHALPEYKAKNDARKARDKAGKDLPEYKASKDAEKAFQEVYKKELLVPRKARDDARKARDAKVKELSKADPDTVKINEQIKEIDAKLKALKKAKGK